MAKFISLDNLTYFWGKVKTWVQGLGYQTAQDVESTLSGKGYATTSDVTSATADMATQSWVVEQGYLQTDDLDGYVQDADIADMATKTYVTGLGYQTASDVTSAVESATEGMATETWVGEQGYQTASQVDTAITSKGYDTVTSVDGKVEAAKTELQGAIDAAVSSVYTPKGSVAFASLPAMSADAVGDVYNVTDAFTTTDSFVEGSGKKYPSGTNVVCVTDGDAQKWDVLAGMVDLSGYVQASDLETVTTTEIDAMFE